LRGQNNVQGASDMGAMPFHYPGYMRVDNEANAQKWEQTWNIEPGGLSRKLGLTTTEILGHAHEGGVRALYIMGENPMMSEPNLNETRKHMQQLNSSSRRICSSTSRARLRMSSCLRLRSRKRMGRSPTRTGESNGCGRLIRPAGWRVQTGKFSAIWRAGSSVD
jgi:anaerobic selenocysteine-containing dehydrogenase